MASNNNCVGGETGVEGSVTADGKNKYAVVCQYCDTCILTPNSAAHTSLSHTLPHPRQRKDEPQHQQEEVRVICERCPELELE